MAILSLYCMNTILFGNGFNMLSPNCPSWDILLSKISSDSYSTIIKGIPPTFQYEQIFLKSIPISDEIELKKEVIKQLQDIQFNNFYRRLQLLKADVYLTTNYDHVFYNNSKSLIDFNDVEKIYSIRRWKRIKINDLTTSLYFIHGDIDAPKSIMLGFDHYAGAIAKIENYVKGDYSVGKSQKIPSIEKRIKNGLIKVNPKEYGFKDSKSGILSWIDTFFFSNIHIIGLSLDLAEIDIWWLLNRRARLMKNGKLDNKIYYYPTFPLSEIHVHLPKLRLLEKLNVKIIHHQQFVDIISGQNDYDSIYNEQLDNLRKYL